MNNAGTQSFHRALERAITRKAKQAIEGKQADHSPAASGPAPAPFITQPVTSKRMTDEEYQVVMLSKMKAYIRNKLTAISNSPSNSKGNQ
jgi:hypothetical protein